MKTLKNLGLNYNTWKDYYAKKQAGEYDGYGGCTCYWTLKYYATYPLYNTYPVFQIKIGMHTEKKVVELSTKKDVIEYIENETKSKITYIELCNAHSGLPYNTIQMFSDMYKDAFGLHPRFI